MSSVGKVQSFRLISIHTLRWIAAITLAFPLAARATTYTVLHSFNNTGGANPFAGLLQATDSNLYGTTTGGGTGGYGTIFMTDLSGNLTTLHSFNNTDGASPSAALIQASDSNLYGTALMGGSGSHGTVFKMDLLGNLTALHSFAGYPTDGDLPNAGLIQAADSNLYGTTALGGAGNYGVVFKMDLSGTLTTFHSFNNTDGAEPHGLIQATDGYLYGTTFQGGASGFGTIFKIDLSGNLTTLHSFNHTDGANPFASLIQASDGNFYGTAQQGGAAFGTVFKMDSSGNLTTLHSFNNTDGAYPQAGLIQAADGNLYGTTTGGGTGGYGTIFMTDLSGNLTTLHSFNNTDGANPYAAGLIQAADSKLYGTAYNGGSGGVGVVFQLAVCLPPSITPSGPTTFCQGGSITLDAGAGNASYLWSPGGETTQTILVSASGSYSVTVTNGIGCQATSAPVVVTVNPDPTPTVGNSGPLCEGQTLQLTCSSFSGATYNWTGPNGFTSGLRNPTISNVTVIDAGDYAVTVTLLGCSSGPVSTTVVINPLPAPVITVTHCLTPNTSGLTASVPATAGDTYAWTITGGTIDSGQGSATINFTSGGPATLMALSVDETNTTGCTGNAGDSMKVNFLDVLPSNPFYNFICTIARHAITAGCGSGNFCPTNSVLRSQMAVFLLRGEHGSSYLPPPCAGIFSDVTCPSPFADWIERLSNEGITGGCSTNPLLYCPSNPVSRAGMSVFLLVAQHGSGYVPPACVGLFADVPCPSPFANWIEQLYSENITGGCNTNPLMYCPGNSVTRAQMAVFLTATFALP